MIDNFSNEFMGIGEPYPKNDIVNFLSSTTGQPKSFWSNKSDAIYYSYHRAVKDAGQPIWNTTDPTGSDQVVNYVAAETGINRNDVYRYLLALYTMASMGKIKTEIWNPAGSFSAYGTKQITENIKQFLSPVTDTAAAPAKKLMTGLAIAAVIAAVGMYASKAFIKEKIKTRGKR